MMQTSRCIGTWWVFMPTLWVRCWLERMIEEETGDRTNYEWGTELAEEDTVVQGRIT